MQEGNRGNFPTDIAALHARFCGLHLEYAQIWRDYRTGWLPRATALRLLASITREMSRLASQMAALLSEETGCSSGHRRSDGPHRIASRAWDRSPRARCNAIAPGARRTERDEVSRHLRDGRRT